MALRSAVAAAVLAALPAAAQVEVPSTAPAPLRSSAPAAEPAPVSTSSAGQTTPALVAVPGGRFRAGERIGPLADTFVYHRVAPFLMDATEVTVSSYAACVAAGRCTPAATSVLWQGLPAAERARWSEACNGARVDRADHPVNCVDWFQAEAFCAFAGKRLPTEEEWEWAARGGSAGKTYPWGETPPADRACWSGEGSAGGARRTGTCPVASHPSGASAAGIHDLAGDVWEWTATRDVVFADSRGRGGSPARIARGGGWGDDRADRLTAARRAKDLPGDRAADLGFRCVRSR